MFSSFFHTLQNDEANLKYDDVTKTLIKLHTLEMLLVQVDPELGGLLQHITTDHSETRIGRDLHN